MRKLSPAQRGLSGFPRSGNGSLSLRQDPAVQTCHPQLRSQDQLRPVSKIAQPPCLHLGIFTPFPCQQLNGPSGEPGTFTPWYRTGQGPWVGRVPKGHPHIPGGPRVPLRERCLCI